MGTRAAKQALAPQLENWLRLSCPPVLAVARHSHARTHLHSQLAEILTGTDDQIITSDDKQISIKAIRSLTKFIALHPFGEFHRIAICNAQLLTAPAAAALLKTLEEPLSKTNILLTTSTLKKVLPTIRSRCQIVWPTANSEAQAPSLTIQDVLIEIQKNSSVPTTKLVAIEHELERKLRKVGPTPLIRQTYARLRDYYRVQETAGASRAAKDALLASLLNLMAR